MRVKKWVKFGFSSFWSCRAFKSLTFVKRCVWVDFHHAGSSQTKGNLAFHISSVKVSVLSKSLIFVKRGIWLVFHQARSSQNEQSLSLQEKTSENCFWASNTLVQKPCSFKFFSILKENCAADMIDEIFKCKSFVGKCCKKRPLSKSYFPTKALFFSSFSAS